jgi:DNA-binding response OmpR family regulator
VPSESPTSEANPDTQTETSTESVLVIDDNRPLADAFASVLSSEYEVTTAYTLADARASLDPEIDAVLLDRRLPDGSGDELLEEMRADDDEYRVAVVSATEKSPDLDYDAYVTKPLSGTGEVRETVEALLHGDR